MLPKAVFSKRNRAGWIIVINPLPRCNIQLESRRFGGAFTPPHPPFVLVHLADRGEELRVVALTDAPQDALRLGLVRGSANVQRAAKDDVRQKNLILRDGLGGGGHDTGLLVCVLRCFRVYRKGVKETLLNEKISGKDSRVTKR